MGQRETKKNRRGDEKNALPQREDFGHCSSKETNKNMNRSWLISFMKKKVKLRSAVRALIGFTVAIRTSKEAQEKSMNLNVRFLLLFDHGREKKKTFIRLQSETGCVKVKPQVHSDTHAATILRTRLRWEEKLSFSSSRWAICSHAAGNHPNIPNCFWRSALERFVPHQLISIARNGIYIYPRTGSVTCANKIKLMKISNCSQECVYWFRM